MGHTTKDVPYISLAQEYGVGSADLSTAHIMELGDTAGPGLRRLYLRNG